METMMEGGSNAATAVLLTTRPRSRCPPNSSAMAVSVTGSAEEEAFEDEESTVLSALLGGREGLISGTPSDSSFRQDGRAPRRHEARRVEGGERNVVSPVAEPRDDQRQTPKIPAMSSKADNIGPIITRGGVFSPGTGDSVAGVVGVEFMSGGMAMKPSAGAADIGRANTNTPPSSSPETAFGCGYANESSPLPTSMVKPAVPDSLGDGDGRENGGIEVEGDGSSKVSFGEATAALTHNHADADCPGSRESSFATAQTEFFVGDSEEAVPLLGPGNGDVSGKARASGRGDGRRNGFAPPKSFSSVIGQAEARGEFSGAGVCGGSREISGRGSDSGNDLKGPKGPNGFVEKVVQGVSGSTIGNKDSNNSSTSSSANNITISGLTEESAESSSSAKLLRRQVESLLSRVEFLERRQQGLDANAAARAAAAGAAAAAAAAASYATQATAPGFPEGMDGVGGWGSSSGSRRRVSEFVSEDAVDYCRGQGTAMLTPPPRSARGVVGGREGSGDASLMMGVSTTPFTGLDVLFRTPKMRDLDQGQHRHRLEHPPPQGPSPSRGTRARWGAPRAPPSLSPSHPQSPQRSRLTWCAGDSSRGVAETRNGRVPPVGTPGSQPPELKLFSSDDGGVVEVGEAERGEGVETCRPRSGTDVAAAWEGVGGGGRGLFLSGRDSRRWDGTPSPGRRRSTRRKSRSRSRSPLIKHRVENKDEKPSSPSRQQSEERVANATEGVSTRGNEEERLSAGEGDRGCSPGPISLLGYLRVEIFGAEDHGEVDAQANRTVRNFLTVPRQLERLLLFGMLVCLDTFLYVTTFLPIRIVIGVVSALVSLVTRRSAPRMNRPLLYDWMRGGTIAAALCALQFLEMSRVYHYIRGQAMVKLYVLTAMMEIFDKLMCSFGQDALDSLYLSTVHKRKRRVLMHFVVVCVTACLHSLLLFVHVTTLTVAVNSSDQALLTLLISNNFAEIKSSVFKKFDKHNLFQLSCHDVVERFKLALFLGMIVLLNVCQGGPDDPVSQFSSMFVMVFGGEVLADWIKHGFIIKFNQLTPSIYQEYSTILARDVASFRKDDGSTLDHTHFVARRLAFATVPLNCVMIRFMQMAIPKMLQRLPSAPPAALWVTAILFYFLALALKILTGISLMAQACTLHPDAVISSTAAATWLRSPVHGSHKTRRELSLEKLSTIERFTLWKGRIV